jgi:anti-anti-sigma factor
MSFNVSLSKKGQTAVVTLSGELDDTDVEQFREKIIDAAGGNISRLVLEMSTLERLSAAGLRGMAFCGSKLSDEVEIVVVAPNEEVRTAIEGVNFQQSVVLADSVPQ